MITCLVLMIYRIILSLLLICIGLFYSCGHQHTPPSKEMLQAYSIQQQALYYNRVVDTILLDGNHSSDKYSSLTKRKSNWLENMIEVPYMEHDHTNCSHDHTRPTVSLTDQEMVVVQQAWLDTILQIKEDLDIVK